VLIQKLNLQDWASVAYACNPSYSGGRDQEDHGSKPVQANSWQAPTLKNPSQKRAGGVGPEFKPQYHKKKKEKKNETLLHY
jgi:hypothetical protein